MRSFSRDAFHFHRDLVRQTPMVESAVEKQVSITVTAMPVQSMKEPVCSALITEFSLRLTLTGLALGVILALALTRVMTRFLFDVSATDPSTFAAVADVLLTVALLACYLPARRATRVDPMMAL